MKFNTQETEFIAKYGKSADWAAFSYYDLTRQEQGVAKTFQINNLLVNSGDREHRYTWTEYGLNVAGKAVVVMVEFKESSR